MLYCFCQFDLNNQPKKIMKNINPLILCDFYKQTHYAMYPDDTTMIYSNFTPRKSRFPEIQHVVVFGVQYFVKEYLISQWNDNFFNLPWETVARKYKRMMDATLGKDSVDLEHIKQLHDLGYLPLIIKALPEGSLCGMKVPALTMRNTVDHAAWLVNFLETILSCTVWQSFTSATVAHRSKKLADDFSLRTVGNTNFTQWQFHDFSMRGLSSLESACMSGAGHLLSFTGSDSIPAIEFLEQYYNADVDKELVAASVPATEHSIICMGLETGELETFRRLLSKFPTGPLSMVSDTWSLPKLVAKYLPILKDEIMFRNGTLVIRPDSFWTTPADCLCGFDGYHPQMDKLDDVEKEMVRKGLIESLWDIFGGTITEKGYKLLDSHISAIYGDSCNFEMSLEILDRLEKKGFASINTLIGSGSFLYQFNTRDTFGFAMKATYGEVSHVGREIYKDPITDSGMKKSAKGLLRVDKIGNDFILKDQCTWEEEAGGELIPVFENGKLLVDQTLAEIRERLRNS